MAGAVLLQLSSVCWANGPEARDVAVTIHGGGGHSELSNNEGSPTTYDERHVGLGVLGKLHLWSEPSSTPDADLGGLQLGFVAEARAHRLVDCGYSCAGDERPGFVPEWHFGARVGVGYDFELVGVRGGLLLAAATEARLAEPLLLPDVLVRLGPRRRVWMELGLGAYDASSTLRPGLYVGVVVVAIPRLTASLHYGWHAGTGSLGGTVLQLGDRLDAGLDYRISARLQLGVGGSYQSADGVLELGPGMGEARARLSFVF